MNLLNQGRYQPLVRLQEQVTASYRQRQVATGLCRRLGDRETQYFDVVISEAEIGRHIRDLQHRLKFNNKKY